MANLLSPLLVKLLYIIPQLPVTFKLALSKEALDARSSEIQKRKSQSMAAAPLAICCVRPIQFGTNAMKARFGPSIHPRSNSVRMQQPVDNNV